MPSRTPLLSAAVVAILLSSEPVAAQASLDALYQEGATFQEFLDAAEARRQTWEENWARSAVPDDVQWTLRGLEGNWRLLVVAEDWCGDSANTVPYIARLVAERPDVEMRVIDSEVGKDVMASRPTPDGRAATPTVVILDSQGREAGCWIERPGRQRSFFEAHVRGAGDAAQEEAVDQFLRWYHEDAGASTLREIALLLDAAGRGARGCSATP